MAVLTQQERAMILGKISSTPGERQQIVEKLRVFQISKVDQGYVLAINSLIPHAVAKANKAVRQGKESTQDSVRWDRIFHGEMKRLAQQNGLRA
jgi:hypothetical protein